MVNTGASTSTSKHRLSTPRPKFCTSAIWFAVKPQVTSLGDDWFKISVVNSSTNELKVKQGLVITRMTPTAGPAMVITLFAGGSAPYTEPESQAS